MKAVVISDYGHQFALADIPVPQPGPGQMLVKVRAAALNPVDLAVAKGGIAELTFPHVPGNDFAGTVTAIGSHATGGLGDDVTGGLGGDVTGHLGDGVTGNLGGDVAGYKVGDEVFGHAVPRALRAVVGKGKPSLGTGTLAEFVVVEADTPFIAHRPADLSPVEAAALGTAGITARAIVETAAIRAGERVLVIGATGGVGTTLLPLLRAAHVIATGHPDDEPQLRELGAGQVIEYGHYPAGVDTVLNLALPSDQLTDAARALRLGGRLFTITFPMPRPEFIDRDDVEFRLILDTEGALGGAADITALRPTIARTYTLDDGPQALHDLAHEHVVGKLVIEM
ncbi:NADPH:quinone reductase [Actinoplanes sp. OR16]|uniref:NADP-dependent oxidoreductase n=1 Tax=Actinoplanes sp. OR16 TaxID=946334 RepID=UPI000F6D4DAE|nr:NADP-dependent oxidoreductase [Actinoplanes sp. OR16]BBH63362.1 NADPH:quinone reductase [Actinoplanes sp. OR16]